MGSYAILRIADTPVRYTKNAIDPLVMALFRPADRYSQQTTSLGDVAAEYGREEELEAEVEVLLLEYRSTVGRVRDRLDLMGYSLATAKQAFEEGLVAQRQRADEWAQDDTFADIAAGRQAGMRDLSFERWLELMPAALKSDRVGGSSIPTGRDDLDYMLGERDEGFGFETEDVRLFLRAVCEAFGADERLTYDLTDLVLGGWYDSATDLSADADDLVTSDYVTTQRIIVLTEGSSDARAVRHALAVLSPHLVDYFSFLNFDQLRMPGGAGALVGTIKAFASAGIANRVVALFDNDTAAASALRGLDLSRLPRRIRVVTYPPLPLLRDYPTIGPSGTVNLDINGCAGSVELYFGEDVLRGADGMLSPVQWKGFDTAVGRYQGEVMNKGGLQERFAAKVAECVADPAAVGKYDWNGMRAVTAALCEAGAAAA